MPRIKHNELTSLLRTALRALGATITVSEWDHKIYRTVQYRSFDCLTQAETWVAEEAQRLIKEYNNA